MKSSVCARLIAMQIISVSPGQLFIHFLILTITTLALSLSPHQLMVISHIRTNNVAGTSFLSAAVTDSNPRGTYTSRSAASEHLFSPSFVTSSIYGRKLANGGCWKIHHDHNIGARDEWLCFSQHAPV